MKLDTEEQIERFTEALTTIREICQEYGVKADLRIGPINGQIYEMTFAPDDKDSN